MSLFGDLRTDHLGRAVSGGGGGVRSRGQSRGNGGAKGGTEALKKLREAQRPGSGAEHQPVNQEVSVRLPGQGTCPPSMVPSHH